jgi:hypothetical protein
MSTYASGVAPGPGRRASRPEARHKLLIAQPHQGLFGPGHLGERRKAPLRTAQRLGQQDDLRVTRDPEALFDQLHDQDVAVEDVGQLLPGQSLELALLLDGAAEGRRQVDILLAGIDGRLGMHTHILIISGLRHPVNRRQKVI